MFSESSTTDRERPSHRRDTGAATHAPTAAGKTNATRQAAASHAPRIGAHLPHPHGLLAAASRAQEIGAAGVQIFTDNPTSWKRRPELPPEVHDFRERMAGVGPLCLHAPYLVNLAGSDAGFHARSVHLLIHELALAPDYGARFVNVHIGSHRGAGREAGIERLIEGLARVLGETADGAGAPLLVLENGAGGGYSLGTTIEELAAILDAAGARRGLDESRLAFCLDSAHLWAAGHDVGDPERVDELVEEFDDRIGLGRLAMIHFNDSSTPRGSRHDRHSHIGEGTIATAGLARLLRHPGLAEVAFYLETPGMECGFDAVNLSRAADLAAGRPLSGPGIDSPREHDGA